MSTIPATIAIIPAKDAFLRNGLTAALPWMTDVQLQSAIEYIDAAYPRVGDRYARSECDYICSDAAIASARFAIRTALEVSAPPQQNYNRGAKKSRFI
jgi:hypothetical protein